MFFFTTIIYIYEIIYGLMGMFDYAFPAIVGHEGRGVQFSYMVIHTRLAFILKLTLS